MCRHAMVRYASIVKKESMRIKAGPAAIKGEAIRYRTAMRVLAGLAARRLETPAQVRGALAMVDRYGADLRYHSSWVIDLIQSHPVFSGSLRNLAADRAAAEAFRRAIKANPMHALSLPGAPSLVTQLRFNVGLDFAALARLSRSLGRFSNQSSTMDAGSTSDKYRRKQRTYADPSDDPNYWWNTATPGWDIIMFGEYIVGLCLAVTDNAADQSLGAFFVYEFCIADLAQQRADCIAKVRSQNPLVPNPAAEAACSSIWAADVMGCAIYAAGLFPGYVQF